MTMAQHHRPEQMHLHLYKREQTQIIFIAKQHQKAIDGRKTRAHTHTWIDIICGCKAATARRRRQRKDKNTKQASKATTMHKNNKQIQMKNKK